MNKIEPIKIGKILIKSPIFLAPMVDITDLPYRLICRKAGAGMAYTEMLYVDAIIHENEKTKKLMQTIRGERPLGIQITGNKLEHFKKVIPYLKRYDIVDLNCGCPSEKLVKNEAGGYLLSNPKLIGKIIRLLKDNGLTVTAKIRLGYDKNNAIEIAKVIENAGADAITVHARLAVQGYDVKADWDEIKKIKKSVKIPVIANGDILSLDDAINCFKQTNCDGLMIARGAIGNPFLFKQIKNYFVDGKKIEFDFDENINYLKEYLELCKKYKFNDLSRIKRISCKFIHSIPGGGKIRDKVMHLKSINEIEKLVSSS